MSDCDLCSGTCWVPGERLTDDEERDLGIKPDSSRINYRPAPCPNGCAECVRASADEG